MKIRAVVPLRYQNLLERDDAKRELADIQAFLDTSGIEYGEGAIEFTPLSMRYVHSDRQLHMACLFVNTLEGAIQELHAVVRLKLADGPAGRSGSAEAARNAVFAKTTFDFAPDFMGRLNRGEAMLIHIGIPTKGLHEDEAFSVRDFVISVSEVRVTPAPPLDEPDEREGCDDVW
ncbi:Uncharacterised protein [uncultured Collinsella sp.]|nr:Uncharacterised protein [uncultured Collinsella sp.]